MTVRPTITLGDRIDFDLRPGAPTAGFHAWLRGGPSDGTQVTVPPHTEVLYAYNPGVEVALTPEAVLPGVAVYERDLVSATGGFNVFRYVRTDPIRQKKAKTP